MEPPSQSSNFNKQPRRENNYCSQCNKCNQCHRGECNNHNCFTCGKSDHFSRHCSNHGQNRGNDQPKPIGTAPQVYALTQGDKGSGTSDMVSGQLYVANNSAYVLMDTNASHSFIAASYVDMIDRKPGPMENVCGVSLPSGEDMMVRSRVRVVPVWVEGQELTMDLLVLDLHEYDVIFGMDWLTKYGAVVNCK
ncbi:uncharacterized protein LOC133806293 [Humulus lupulus]|uniref:uncharacterized protein LOC133806293 n=1 Tax=Humulus lupulus TaxID=3486 RepID=UPI002B406647|nr:uncharacterized protein LOC133806293 [Humulus lupulus]